MCPIQALPKTWPGQWAVYNFTSMYELPQIIPIKTADIPIWDDGSMAKQMDYKFAEYLMTDEVAFVGLMTMMRAFSLGCDVFVLIDNHGYNNLENLNESLIKFIQQRYGFTPYRINELSDLDANDYYQSFTVPGIVNFDEDMNRYIMIGQRAVVSNMMMTTGGNVDESAIIRALEAAKL